MPPPKTDRLTLKQQRFVAEYVKGNGNGTQAALSAGYAQGTNYQAAAVRAHEAVRNRKVAKAIRLITNRAEISANRVVNRLDNLSFAAEKAGNHSVSVKAEELLGKSLGMFIDRSLSINVDVAGTHLEALHAIAKRRAERRNKAGDDAIDVTPDDDTQ